MIKYKIVTRKEQKNLKVFTSKPEREEPLKSVVLLKELYAEFHLISLLCGLQCLRFGFC